MKTITVNIEYSAGMSHSGWMGTEETITKEVSDEVAATLQNLIDTDEPDEYRSERGATAEAVAEAIEAGHTELQQLHDELREKYYDMDEEYWLFEADNECIDESLEPYFYQDVEDGLYEPQTDDDYDPESGYEPDSFEACSGNYLDWVNSHRDDHYFVAERVGVDLSACREDDPYYIITGIK